MTSFRTLADLTDLSGKTALVRVDFNVPMEGGKVSDDTRLRAALPTINALRDLGAKVVLMAHFGRPKGQPNAEMSLRPVVEPLELLLSAPVWFAEDCIGDAPRAVIADDLAPGGVALLENVREPDAGKLSELPLGLTMGMMLSIPMMLIGAWLIWRAWSRPPVAPEA